MIFCFPIYAQYLVSQLKQTGIVTTLIIVIIFFAILLILGVRKTYKLKKENERLNEISALQSDDENKTYRDFTEGHLYDNK